MFPVNSELGSNIAKFRKKAGITQEQLANNLTSMLGEHVSLKTVSNWERAVVDIPAAIMPAICHVLHCSSFDLYPHSDHLTDRDVSLIAHIAALPDDEKNDLYYLITQWSGDRRALMKLNVIHAVLPPRRRWHADCCIIEEYKDAVKTGEPDMDSSISTDLEYVTKVWNNLDTE